MNIAAALQWAKMALEFTSEDPKVDAEILLCHVLLCQPTRFHAWPEQTLTMVEKRQFEKLVSQRKVGKPVAYLTGCRGFWSLDLTVSESTLIPRPETEILVACVLEKLKAGNIVADLGTGSGAIACAIAASRSDVRVLAMDFSVDALHVARENSQDMPFWQGNWSQALANKSVDIIVSNPPYIAAQDPHLQQGDVQFEPQTALVSGQDGLDDLREIIGDAPRCLKLGGWLMVEHGYNQGVAVKDLFIAAGFVGIAGIQDLVGQDRVTYGKYDG